MPLEEGCLPSLFEHVEVQAVGYLREVEDVVRALEGLVMLLHLGALLGVDT
jgi:hypothetical protein